MWNCSLLNICIFVSSISGLMTRAIAESIFRQEEERSALRALQNKCSVTSLQFLECILTFHFVPGDQSIQAIVCGDPIQMFTKIKVENRRAGRPPHLPVYHHRMSVCLWDQFESNEGFLWFLEYDYHHRMSVCLRPIWEETNEGFLPASSEISLFEAASTRE